MMRPYRERNREGISRVDAVIVQPLTGTAHNPEKPSSVAGIPVKCRKILQSGTDSRITYGDRPARRR